MSGVAVDPSGAAILAGTSYGTIDFGGNPRTNQTGTDVFLARLNTP